MQETVKNLLATTQRLAEMEPQNEAVDRTVKVMQEQVAQLTSEVEKPAGEGNSFGKNSRKQDVDFLHEQIKRLKSAAIVPASNYRRIVSILGELDGAITLAARPQNAAIRPKLAAVVKQLAGIFAEVDTVQDLDKPLEAIEKAVHGLYGDQSKNSTFYFDRRNKGHRSPENKEPRGEVK
jgi:hypothetical protein